MKKFFTLALTLLILNAAFSQTIVSRVVYKTPSVNVSYSHRYVENYSFNQYERNTQLEHINAGYNQQLKEIMNLHVGSARKVDLIQQLQREKAIKVKNVNDRFYDARNKYNYNYYDKNYNWKR